jgi:hypothetical protein
MSSIKLFEQGDPEDEFWRSRFAELSAVEQQDLRDAASTGREMRDERKAALVADLARSKYSYLKRRLIPAIMTIWLLGAIAGVALSVVLSDDTGSDPVIVGVVMAALVAGLVSALIYWAALRPYRRAIAANGSSVG